MNLTTRFGPRDRPGALAFAVRHARETGDVHVLFFDYKKDEWAVSTYEDFAHNPTVLSDYENIRYVLLYGEITRLS